MEIKQIPLHRLKCNEGQIEGLPTNPRYIKDEKFELLKRSLQESPEMLHLRELLVYPHGDTYIVIGGNMRLRAAEELGIEELPCKVLPATTPVEKLREYTIKDNNGYGEYDWDILANEWDEMPLADWGVDMPAFEEMADSEEETPTVEEDDFDEDNDTIVCRCARGDVWQLGNHRVMCGDSTSEADVEKLRGGVLADMVFTDPPYGMGKESEGVLNDNLNLGELLLFNSKWIEVAMKGLSKVGSFYMWGTAEPLMQAYSEIFMPLMKQRGENKLTFRNLICWDKGEGGFGVKSHLQRMYPLHNEYCLFFMRGRQDYGQTKEDYWDGFEPLRKKIDQWCEIIGKKKVRELTCSTCTHWWSTSQWEFITEPHYNTLRDYCIENNIQAFREESDKIREEYDKIREEWYKTRAYFDNTHDNMNEVWRFPTTSGKESEDCGGHATPKPIAVCSRAIKSSSREGDVVLDVFGGSGSTLIACEQLNRKCLMMELDTHYCDVIIARWEKLTGLTAIKIE